MNSLSWEVVSSGFLGAIVGALLGAFASYNLQVALERRKDSARRNGLLAILTSEMRSMLDIQVDESPSFESFCRERLRSFCALWRDYRGDLAPLVTADLFLRLNGYYLKCLEWDSRLGSRPPTKYYLIWPEVRADLCQEAAGVIPHVNGDQQEGTAE